MKKKKENKKYFNFPSDRPHAWFFQLVIGLLLWSSFKYLSLLRNPDYYYPSSYPNQPSLLLDAVTNSLAFAVTIIFLIQLIYNIKNLINKKSKVNIGTTIGLILILICIYGCIIFIGSLFGLNLGGGGYYLPRET